MAEIYEDAFDVFDGPAAPAEPVFMADINATIRGHVAIHGAVSEQAKTRLGNLIDVEIRRVLSEANEVSAARVQELHVLAERMGIRLQKDLAEKDRVLQVTQTRFNNYIAGANASSFEAVREIKELVGTKKLTTKEWMFFFTKIGIEIYISVVEPLAARQKKRNHWMKWSGLALAIVLLIMSLIEIVVVQWRSKNPVFENGKVKLRRIRWVLDVYGVLISIIAIVLFALSFRFPAALHIALYACTFSGCMLAENLVRQCTSKNIVYEVSRHA